MRRQIDDIIEDLSYIWRDLSVLEVERLQDAWRDVSGQFFVDELRELGNDFNKIIDLLEDLKEILLKYGN